MPSRPKFTGFCEHNRALGRERFAEQDSIDAGDKPHKRFPSRLYRTGPIARPPGPAGCMRSPCLWGKKLSCFGRLAV
jgi:hypothetical protein